VELARERVTSTLLAADIGNPAIRATLEAAIAGLQAQTGIPAAETANAERLADMARWPAPDA
jgi:hypothetical protein